MSGAIILDGKWLAGELQTAMSEEVAQLAQRAGRAPGLAVILVGQNPASKVYVGNKAKAAKKCGFQTFDSVLPESCSPAELEKAIQGYNQDDRVDGILLQLPLPKHLSANKFLDLIDSNKDADGLHPLNQGLLQRGEGVVRPCTPLGAIALIDLALAKIRGEAYQPKSPKNYSLEGMNAIVVGRSILVGKPVAAMLLERNATVTMAHSKTKDLPGRVAAADVVIAAVGAPKLIEGDWIKKDAIVIDVGINRTSSGELVGDVDFDSAKTRAGAITPVPGGVGPLTITMLLRNTLAAFRQHIN